MLILWCIWHDHVLKYRRLTRKTPLNLVGQIISPMLISLRKTLQTPYLVVKRQITQRLCVPILVALSYIVSCQMQFKVSIKIHAVI
jgi:hypothetical protein